MPRKLFFCAVISLLHTSRAVSVPLNERLFSAAGEGDVELVRELLRGGADLHFASQVRRRRGGDGALRTE